MTRLAILSDTHGLLREEVKRELTWADCAIHAGDVDTPAVLEAIRGYGETYVVRGNNDSGWARDLPQTLTVDWEGVRFFLVHNRKDVPRDLADVDVVVYGHSHKFAAQVIDGVLWLNPGSCGRRRFHLDLTLCRMEVDRGRYRWEKMDLPC